MEHEQPPQRHEHYGGALRIAVAVSLGMLIVESYAAWVTGSLALLSDAAHMLADLLGLILAYMALRLASRPATAIASFGFQRYEVLAAGANGLILLGMVTALFWRAFHRLQNPIESLDTRVILAVATLGLLANIIAAFLLQKGKDNINAKGALANVLGDAIASLGVIVATLIVHFTGKTEWDTYVSFAVALIILVPAWKLLKQTWRILLEATPEGIDLHAMKAQVEDIPGVVNVHDLHCWTITPGQASLTMHASIERSQIPTFHHVIRNIEEYLELRWGLRHCTIQVEPEGEDALSDAYDPVDPAHQDKSPTR